MLLSGDVCFKHIITHLSIVCPTDPVRDIYGDIGDLTFHANLMPHPSEVYHAHVSNPIPQKARDGAKGGDLISLFSSCF